MSLYRHRKSRFWQFKFEIDGHRFSGSTKCTDKREARDEEAAQREKAEELIKNMRATKRRPMTVGSAFDRWWEEHGSTLSSNEKFSVDWLADQLGRNTLLHAIDNDMVSRAVQARKKTLRRAGRDDKGKQLYRPVSPTTVNTYVPVLLRRIMRRARDNWNAAIVNEPNWRKHMLPVPIRAIREITRAEESALDAHDDEDYRALRRFALIYGLRRREMLLTWPQVDFENGVFRILAKGKRPRILPLTREAYQIIWSRRGHHPLHVFTFVAKRTRKLTIRGRKIEQIAGSRYPITYWGFGSRKNKVWAAAGVTARIHDLRHTAGMRTLRATQNLKSTQVLLGHSDIKTTAKFYTDATLEDLHSAIERTSEANAPAPMLPLLPKPQSEN